MGFITLAPPHRGRTSGGLEVRRVSSQPGTPGGFARRQSHTRLHITCCFIYPSRRRCGGGAAAAAAAATSHKVRANERVTHVGRAHALDGAEWGPPPDTRHAPASRGNPPSSRQSFRAALRGDAWWLNPVHPAVASHVARHCSSEAPACEAGIRSSILLVHRSIRRSILWSIGPFIRPPHPTQRRL